jgi:hypothetical protein
VEKRKPRSGSYFSTALMRPMLPSWMRSSNGRPIPRYFLATDTTSRRFFSMSFFLARRSPALARSERSISSAWVSQVAAGDVRQVPGERVRRVVLARDGAPARRQASPEVVVVAGGFFAFVALISLLVAGGLLPCGVPVAGKDGPEV